MCEGNSGYYKAIVKGKTPISVCIVFLNLNRLWLVLPLRYLDYEAIANSSKKACLLLGQLILSLKIAFLE